ncbi:TetR/AcrR family transcriptional regulator [Rhodococcus triatomae]|uniref:DNA-binding transcriptional regulator, AcrR family n=1 Tax=Rhodococcus triatomae TaxID=300028 RepID=A0A1G8FQA3_9NOCA|nr:TetR/AcrR family transcriptional regulator [Rhodococcus triatomae]QNG19545.1 TetR/AcrR family transcriptional regulator [Rhodococcus triatomae]QNG24540.1 TetR/AcrR family transcriptional regulator [Rhodococcus triatomae]SDH84280.1 DNA-binding transcriptional regulator, AcrR family [Rhodococcus triatomae]
MARTVDPQRTAQRRSAITHAAATLFAEQGFERTSAAQIARATGLSSGSVFYYFPDKAAVFRSIFEQSIPEHTALVSGHIDRTDCLDAVLDLVETLAGESLDPVAPGLMVELLRRIDQDPELAQVVAEDARISTDAVTTLLARGIALGQIDRALAPEETARWILSIVDAAFLNADPDEPHDPRPLLRRTVSRLLQPNRTENPT